MTTATEPKPNDLAFPGLSPDDCCLRMDEGIYGEIRDAAKTPRASAISYFASEAGCDFNAVRCTTRYMRLFTRQEVWNGPGKDRWVDDHIAQHLIDHGVRLPLRVAWTACPSEPSALWEPDESMPCWEFCERTHPNAVRIYVCEVKP